MLHLTQDTKIYLAIEPVDFRKQIDGLIALCRSTLSFDSRSGQLFIFINRSRTMIRVLCYEENGYWLATKRLSQGRYALWPKGGDGRMSQMISAPELKRLLKTGVASRIRLH